MNTVIRYINKSVSVRLSVSILTFVVVIFAVTMAILIHRSKASVRQAAIEESVGTHIDHQSHAKRVQYCHGA